MSSGDHGGGGSGSGNGNGSSQGDNEGHRKGRSNHNEHNRNKKRGGYSNPVIGFKEEFKGGTEGLEDCVFDSTTKKNVEQYAKALKKIATFMGKEHKYGYICKYIIEKGKLPEPMEPEELAEDKVDNKIEFFKYSEKHKDWQHKKNV